MIELRKRGYTYSEIQKALGVSKWACLRYLKDVKVEESAVEEEWKIAEKEAMEFLKKNGFTDIHYLNKICPSPYWDILARKGDEWWLIDVTVSARKEIGAKIPAFVEGYVHAILYKNIHTNEWKLVRMSVELVN